MSYNKLPLVNYGKYFAKIRGRAGSLTDYISSDVLKRHSRQAHGEEEKEIHVFFLTTLVILVLKGVVIVLERTAKMIKLQKNVQSKRAMKG